MTKKNVQEAMMDGQAVFDSWSKKFMSDWQMPEQMQMAKMIFSKVPSDVKEKIKQTDPVAYDNAIRQMNKQ